MNRVRRGKDFKVLWSFFDYNGEPYQLDKTFLTLYVSNSFDRFEVTDFSVEENTITWIFRGKDQKALGDYTLELIQNNGTEGMIPIDSVDAFTLVQYSRDESLCGGGNVKIEDVTVNSTLDIETISSLIDAQLSETSMNPVQNKVITAALNNKADKLSVPTKTSQLTNDSSFITAEEVPAPDWNASTYKEGHIKNRTHHMQDYMCHYFNGSPIKISKPSDTGYVLLTYDTDLADKFIRIEIKANESKTEEFLDAMGMPLIFTWDAGNSTINVQSFGGAIETYGMRAYYSSSAKGYDDYFVALDEGFIPEEVARKRELKTINGQSILGKGDIEIKGGSSTFVTDFTVNDLYELVYRGAHPVQANIVALQRALENKERIVVPYGTEEFMGYSLLQGYYEDLVYFTVADENGSTYVVEVGQYAGEIDRDNITHVSPKENKINIADLQNNIAARNVGAVDVEGGAEAPDAPSGGSYDDTEIKERLEEQDQLIEDLQNMKIDREADDYYPKLAVGLADNLAGVDVVASEINFRRSGGGAITDGVARIESIKGNSVVWNKWTNSSANSATKTENGVTFTKNEDGSFSVVTDSAGATANTYIQIGGGISVINTHKYILYGAAQGGRYETYNAYATNGFASAIYDYGAGAFGTSIGGKTFVVIMVKSGQVISSPLKFSMKLIDLTQMFGSGNEPTTIDEFYARIPMGVDLNAYNEGEVIHMDVQSVESVGRNAWDEEWELGNISNGNDIADSNRIRSKNYIRVFPNTAYYVTTFASTQFNLTMYDADKQYVGVLAKANSFSHTMPSNVHYVRFAIGASSTPVKSYKEGICINISDTSINGKYFPYIKRVEDLSIIRKYFPDGMKSAGSAHDEIRYNKASGKKEYSKGRLKAVDLGTLKFTKSSTGIYYCELLASAMKDAKYGFNLLCARYTIHRGELLPAALPDKSLMLYNGAAYPVLGINDTAYTDAASFKAAMQGVILYYEAAEWEWVELDEADQFKDLDYQVWNAGTEKAIAEGISAPLAADITYGFNAIGKIKELESLVAQLRAKVGI